MSALRNPVPLPGTERAGHDQGEGGLRSFVRNRVYSTGLVLAGLFFALSLTPSLMPRDAVVQGVLGGIVAAVGYETTNLFRSVWHWLGLPWLLRLPPGRALRLALVLGFAIAAIGLWFAADWQNATRAVVGLPPVEESHRLTIAAAALPVFLVLWVFGRGVGLLWRRLAALGQRFVPPRIAAFGAVALVAVLVTTL